MNANENTALLALDDEVVADLMAIATGSDAIADRIAEIRAAFAPTLDASYDASAPFDPLALLMATTSKAMDSATETRLDALYQVQAAVANAEREAAKCPRCGGTGVLPEYRHINGGCCYRCNGSGHRHNG